MRSLNTNLVSKVNKQKKFLIFFWKKILDFFFEKKLILIFFKVCIIRLDHICLEKSSSTFWQVRSCQKYDKDFFQILLPSQKTQTLILNFKFYIFLKFWIFFNYVFFLLYIFFIFISPASGEKSPVSRQWGFQKFARLQDKMWCLVEP